MYRKMGAAVATAVMALMGVAGIEGTGHASNTIIDCDFTVTAAGNGAQVMSTDFSTVVGTLQTGQVFDLFNTTRVVNNVMYWNELGFGQVGAWYPIHDISGNPVFMAKDQNSCSIDNK